MSDSMGIEPEAQGGGATVTSTTLTLLGTATVNAQVRRNA